MAETIQTMQTADIEREVRAFIIEHFLAGKAQQIPAAGSLLGGDN